MAKQGSLIRDLVINVKADDLSKATTEAEKLVNALVDAAQGGEMLKAELNSVKTSLTSVNKLANTTQGIFNNFALNDKFKSSLNQVLEGINRINSSAKDLKGLDISINLKVDNLTQLQQDVSKSIQGLDISINLKAGNLNSTNDRLQTVVKSLEDAAAGVELLNTELNTTKLMMAAIKNDADAAAMSLAKVAISKNLENGLDDVIHALHNISEEIVQLNLDSKESFNSMSLAIGHVDESLGSVNKTLHQTKFATKETATGTKQLVERFDASGNSLGMFEQKVANATKGMRNQSRMMGDLAKLAGPIPAAFAIISAHVWALSAAFDYLASGDQLNRLEKIGTTIGANVGLPVQKLARDMVEATNGAISYEAALRKAANASGYGFSSKELEKMTQVARRAAVVMGVDMDDALNRIIKGVSKQEIELLDELGITVRLTEAQSDYAKQLNTTTDSLTSYQKQQAYLQAVLKQSEKSFGYISNSDLGATNIEKFGAAVSSATDKLGALLAKAANWALDGFNVDSSTTDAVNKTTKSIGAMVTSIEKAKSIGKLDNVIMLSNDAVSGYDSLSLKMKALEKIIEDGGYQVNTLNGKITGTAHLFEASAEQTENAKKALQEYVGVFEEYIKVQQQQDLILRDVLASLGYVGLSTQKQQEILARFSTAMASIHNAAKTSAEGVNTFRASLKDQQTPIDKYNTSLQDIVSIYNQIDQLKIDFPLVPDSAIAKFKELADEAARAAGFVGRVEVSNALQRGKEYKSFTKNTVEKETVNANTTTLQSMGSVSGTAEIANQKRILENRKKELEFSQQDTTNGKENLVTDARRKEILNDISAAQLAIVQASQTEALAKEAMLEQDSRRNNLENQYSAMSASGVNIKVLENELKDRERLLSIQRATGVNAETVYQTETDILETQYKINAANIAHKLELIDIKDKSSQIADIQNQYLAYMKGIPVEYTASIRAQTELNLALEREQVIRDAIKSGNTGYKQSDLLNAQLASEQAKLAKKQADEATVHAQAQQDSNKFELQSITNNMGELDILKGKQELEAQHLENLRNIHASQTAINEQVLKEASVKKQIADLESQRHRDMIQGGIGAIHGENQMQYTSTAGMDSEQAKLASNSDKLANVANSFDQLASYAQPFANVAANLSQMAIAIQDNAGAMEIASMAGQSITSMFQMNGAAAVAAIDAQIAAEKKRDGTSEESLAKIKALEAKKIETTRKTARQTIIMQTAVGVANALAMGNPLIGIPMAIAVSAMGMQALKAADSAAESSLAGLDSAATTGSLTLGDRTNKVDTAQKANAGELSYIQGASGTGGINNFTPRATGGNATAGYSYIAGEKGPELITPKVDSIVSDAQTTRNSTGTSGNISLTVNAIDARSFQDLVYANPHIFRDAVEVSLNQQGRSLP